MKRTEDAPLTQRSVAQAVVPCLLALASAFLGWIGVNIQELTKTVAVAVARIEDHDRRLSNLETLFLRTSNP